MTQQEKSFPLIRENELDEALAYLAKHEQHKHVVMDRDLLRTLGNKMLEKRAPGSKLALLAASVARDNIPPRDKGNVRKVEACTSGIMKIMSIRRVHKLRREQAGQPVSPPVASEPAKYPMRSNGQFVML